MKNPYILYIKNDCFPKQSLSGLKRKEKKMNTLKAWQEQVLDQLVKEKKAKEEMWITLVDRMVTQQTLQKAVNAKPFVPLSHVDPVLKSAVNAVPFVPMSDQPKNLMNPRT